MRRLRFTALSVALILSLVVVAVAHSGRTDANGGHHVGGTSEYHYHHGYSAHQHVDGVCPYNYDDKTEEKSSDRSNLSPLQKAIQEENDKKAAIKADKNPDSSQDNAKNSDDTAWPIIKKIVSFVLAAPIVLYFAGIMIFLFVFCPIRWVVEWIMGRLKKK